MESLVLCLMVWGVVLALLPSSRIRQLGVAGVIAFVWMIFVDNVSTVLGYYSYTKILLPIGRAPFFQNLAEAGIGILLLNWLSRSPLSKLAAILIAGILFVVVHSVYMQRGAFTLGRLDMTLNFIHHVAALTVFMGLSLTAVGEETIYSGRRVRRKISRFV